jgi:hypothetical protein
MINIDSHPERIKVLKIGSNLSLDSAVLGVNLEPKRGWKALGTNHESGPTTNCPLEESLRG